MTVIRVTCYVSRMTETRKSVLRSVRLDDDVWAAIKGMDCSLNQYLRSALLEAGLAPRLTSAPTSSSEARILEEEREILSEPSPFDSREREAAKPKERPFKPPLLKPSEKKK